MFKRTSQRSSKFFSNQKEIDIPTLFERCDRPLYQPNTTDIEDKPIYVAKERVLSTKCSAIDVKPQSDNGVGIFSDTLLYSDFIKSSLQIREINIKHFGHPNTFHPVAYHQYDEVSAWIIFLSDGNSAHSQDRFLDEFLDRYADKPTLFLCTETNRVKTSKKINQFIIETGLFNLSNKAYA